MATSTASRSASTSTHLHPTSVGEDLEPDEAWKENKRQEIESLFADMIKEAKDRLESRVQALTVQMYSPEWMAQKDALVNEFNSEKEGIKNLAREEFAHSVAHERVVKRMATGGSVNATVEQAVLEEQHAIMAKIQKDRRDSTSGPSQSHTISSQAPANRESGAWSPRHETANPIESTSSSSATSHVPVQEPRSNRSSPEIFKPPANQYHPDPQPTHIPSAPQGVPPTTSTAIPFGSFGRTTAPPGGQDRWVPESPSAPGGPVGNRRMSSSYTQPTSPVFPRSEPPRQASSPVQERTTPRSAPPPSHSRPTSQTQDRAPPRSAPPPSHSPSHAMGPPPPPSLHRQTSKTWQTATSIPPAQRPVSSSPRAQRSHNDYHAVSPNSEARNEGWVGPQMTDEPEDEDETDEEEQQPQRSRFNPVSVPPLMPRRDSVREKPMASSPPAPRPPPEVWNPPIRAEDGAQASRSGRERSGSSLRSAHNGRKPIPQPFVEISTPGPDPTPSGIDVKKYAEREAAERREYERSWENIDKSREKERAGSQGRSGGARLSTASEQLRQSERVGSGITRQAEGASKPGSPETNSSYFPSAASAAPSSYPPVNASDNSSYHSTYSSGLTGTSTNHLPNVSSAYSPTTEEEEESDGDGGDSDSDSEDEDDEEEHHSPGTADNFHPSYSSEHKSNAGPSLAWMPPNRSSPYSSHSPAVPIPVPQRARTPEDDPSMPYSAGDYSRYGTPQRERNSYTGSFRGGSYSSHGEDAHLAERERWEREERERERDDMERERAAMERERLRERERERERERVRKEMEQERMREELERERREERERVQRVQEAERAAKKLAEEAERKAEEIRLKEEATKKKEAELLRQQEETERKLREINQREADLRQREEQMRQREEETRQKEAARLREEAAKQREEAERQRKEKERRRVEADRQRLEAEQRFAFQQREAEEARLKEVARQKEEAEKQRKEKERQRAEADKRRLEAEQQFAFQQREAEIKRKADERRRQGSMDADSNWGGSSHSHSSWGTPPVTPARSNTTGSTWSSTSKASSTSSTTRPSSNATPNGKTTWTAPTPSPYSSSAGSQAGARPSASSSSKPTPKASTTNPPPANPDDWARRQREQAEEQFRKMQEQLERERQAKEQKAGRMLTKEDVVRIYQQHEQLWSKMSSHTEVTWDMLPWPMYKKPNSAEEITSGAVDAYIMSPHYPDQDKSTKDRVRQQLRRWHEDHFNQKVLSKVSEGDKERVKAAAGTVTRNLNNLLERANESKKAGSSVFG